MCLVRRPVLSNRAAQDRLSRGLAPDLEAARRPERRSRGRLRGPRPVGGPAGAGRAAGGLSCLISLSSFRCSNTRWAIVEIAMSSSLRLNRDRGYVRTLDHKACIPITLLLFALSAP